MVREIESGEGEHENVKARAETGRPKVPDSIGQGRMEKRREKRIRREQTKADTQERTSQGSTQTGCGTVVS